MRLTKKKAIELSLEKWEDHVKTGKDNAKWDWHEKHKRGTFLADCALCEYGYRQRGTGDKCRNCPYHQKFGHCNSTGYPYFTWVFAVTQKERRESASLFLAQLKELK